MSVGLVRWKRFIGGIFCVGVSGWIEEDEGEKNKKEKSKRKEKKTFFYKLHVAIMCCRPSNPVSIVQ